MYLQYLLFYFLIMYLFEQYLFLYAGLFLVGSSLVGTHLLKIQMAVRKLVPPPPPSADRLVSTCPACFHQGEYVNMYIFLITTIALPLLPYLPEQPTKSQPQRHHNTWLINCSLAM